MNKTILITGASSGIGEACTCLFANSGWNVVATLRDPVNAPAFENVENVFVTRLDVQDIASIEQAIAAGVARFGGIDVLLNNAGFGQYGVFEAIPRAQVLEQFEVNVFGVMDVIRAVLPVMRKARSGVIINMSSGAGLFTLPMISLYCASKFALEGFSEALAFELLSLGIVVKIVEPHGGVTATRFSERAAAGNAVNPELTDYQPFIERSAEAFARMTAARLIDANDVAKVVYAAATDGTDRLRYLVGNDTRGFVKARAELPDQAYVDFLRGHFQDALGKTKPGG
ncbi:MAG: SDR family oxidoreductase [Gammaproteobacteria bacterium]|nr:SDR family oxidoreductase [Gammaproteobacteria bacterium]MCP5423588.1 SDR family oxidoreductase [Gammaproteobacteria bacterium]MCP5459832.1 SDR family oxidoreductase [Gammaproteobacteria bacterium]